MGFSRQEYQSGLLFPSPGDLPKPETEPLSAAFAGGFFTTEPLGLPICFLLNVNYNHHLFWVEGEETEGKLGFAGYHLPAQGFSGGSEDKGSACNAGDPGSIPALGRSPGEGNSNPFQYSCLENPMDRGAWQATVHGVAKSLTRLKN